MSSDRGGSPATRRGPAGSRRRFRVAAGTLVVSAAIPDDADEIVNLFGAVLEEGRYFITDLAEYAATPGWQRVVIERAIQSDNSAFLVGHLDKRLVGVVTVQGGALRRTRHTAKLEIFVDSALRGGGVGRALMQAALDWAEENPTLTKLSLAVFEDNVRAVALYRTLGFEQEGRREAQYVERDGTERADLLLYRWVAERGSQGAD